MLSEHDLNMTYSEAYLTKRAGSPGDLREASFNGNEILFMPAYLLANRTLLLSVLPAGPWRLPTSADFSC